MRGPHVPDGGHTLYVGVHCPAAHEILVGTPSVSHLIREGKTHQIASAIQTGKKEGMVLMDPSLMTLLNQGLITAEEAYAKAHTKADFAPFLNGKLVGV